MKKRILIVEDEIELLEIIEMILLQYDYEIITANNGLEAQKLINESHFDLILSDFQMPEMNGLELFQWAKENKPTPFLLMTGQAPVSSKKHAQELGMNGFISKPFSMEALFVCVEEIFKSPSSKETKSDKYSKIPIDHFYSDHSIPYEIFINLGDGKYKKIAHNSEPLKAGRIVNYKNKGVQFLFLQNKDFISYINMQLSLTKSQLTSSFISAEKKSELVCNVMQDIFEKAYVDGLDQQLFEFSKNALDLAVNNVVQNDFAYALIERLRNEEKVLYGHSLKVSLFSVMIAKKLGYTDQESITNVALGGFYHDIGVKDFQLRTNRTEIRDDGHALKGYQILCTIKNISPVILSIVVHHEDSYGTKWMTRLEETSSLEHIVCIVNKYCNLYLLHKDKTPHQLLKLFVATEVDAANDIKRAFALIFP